jgi:hypothetical protein
MSAPEYIFNGHDNSNEIILKSDGLAIDLSNVTAMTITFGDLTISSMNGDEDPIRWDKAGYAQGEVRFFLGHSGISEGSHHAPLVVYSEAFPEGYVWGNIVFNVFDEVEVDS